MPLLIALALAAAPPPQSCQAALGPLYDGVEEAALPGRVDGAAIGGRDGLLALRRASGAALIVIVGGDFAGADLRGALLGNICFIETNLAGSDWRGAEAPGVGFVRADLTGARLQGARMPHVLFREPVLKDADATGADLSGGRLDGGWQGSLEHVVLDRADLGDFDFACGITVGDGCPLDRSLSLRGADLSGARFNDWWFEADLTGARLDRTQLAFQHLVAARGAELAGPLILRGGDAEVSLSARDHAAILAGLLPEETAADDRPSFDCAAARSLAERLICADGSSTLREQDRELAALYGRAVATDPSVAASQRAWLAERDRCGDVDCLTRAYHRRIGRILGRLGPPSSLRAGDALLFVDEPLRFTEAFRATDLYRRLLPAIVGGPSSRATVRVHADGTIDADGNAIGGNAHLCSLGGERLRFDPDTGWYSGPYNAQPADPAAWSRRPMPVVRIDGETLVVYRHGGGGYEGDPIDPRMSDYATCGARAHFGDMRRVPVTAVEVERLSATLRER